MRWSFIGPERQLHYLDFQKRTAAQWPGEEFGEITGLFKTLDWRKYQLNRPFCSESLRLQRVGKPHAAYDKIGRCFTATVELLFDILAFREERSGW